MAIDKVAYQDKSLEIAKVVAQIEELSNQRTAEEEQLVTTYKINEANEARRLIIENYQPQLEVLYVSLAGLRKQLNNIALEK